MEALILNAEKRTETGKEKAKKIRAKGKVPAILYGEKLPNINLNLDEHDLSVLLSSTRGQVAIVTLKVKDEAESKIVIREVQRDPVTHDLLHADMLRLSETHPIKVQIPIHIKGASIGVKLGGILEHLLHNLEVKALPGDIPRFIEVDITELGLGQSIHINGLNIKDTIEVLQDKDQPVVRVAIPKSMESETTAAETTEAKQPELVEKKKKEKADE